MSRNLDNALAALDIGMSIADRALGGEPEKPLSQRYVSRTDYWCPTCEVSIGVRTDEHRPPCEHCGGELTTWQMMRDDPTRGKGHWRYPP